MKILINVSWDLLNGPKPLKTCPETRWRPFDGSEELIGVFKKNGLFS